MWARRHRFDCCLKAHHAGINVNQGELTYGRTPLNVAAYHGHGACIRLLVGASGIDANQPARSLREHPFTLRLAVATMHAYDCCWVHQGSTSIKSFSRQTPLQNAAFRGRDACVRLLLDAPGNNINQPTTNGWTPLNCVAQRKKACIRMLLDAQGINVNQAETKHGVTPLHTAALAGHVSCVEILRAAPSTDVNHVATDDTNVLIDAISHAMHSLRQIGSWVTTPILVRLMASREVSNQVLTFTFISLMH